MIWIAPASTSHVIYVIGSRAESPSFAFTITSDRVPFVHTCRADPNVVTAAIVNFSYTSTSLVVEDKGGTAGNWALTLACICIKYPWEFTGNWTLAQTSIEVQYLRGFTSNPTMAVTSFIVKVIWFLAFVNLFALAITCGIIEFLVWEVAVGSQSRIALALASIVVHIKGRRTIVPSSALTIT